jgi:copper chaperone NosL
MTGFKALRALFLMLGLGVLAACAKPGPEPIAYGKDSCTNCGMMATDQRFGAEMITKKGKILKFDAVECLATYLDKAGDNVGSLLVVDHSDPSRLVDATRATYLVSEKVPSPMGKNLSAYEHKEAADKMKEQYSGRILSWSEAVAYANQR